MDHEPFRPIGLPSPMDGVFRVSLPFRIAAIKPATIAEIISAPANIKNWIRTSSIFQVQNLNSLLTYETPFQMTNQTRSNLMHHHQNQLLETITAPKALRR